MPQREQGAAVGREGLATAGVDARQAVDGGEVIGIETMLHAEQEDDRGKRSPTGG